MYIHTVYSHRIFTPYIHTVNSHRIFTPYIHTVYSHRTFTSYINTVYSHRIFTSYINTVYSHRIFAPYIRTVYSHRIPAAFPSSHHLFLGLPTPPYSRGFEFETSHNLSGYSGYFLPYYISPHPKHRQIKPVNQGEPHNHPKPKCRQFHSTVHKMTPHNNTITPARNTH